jgi:hypothetical protein
MKKVEVKAKVKKKSTSTSASYLIALHPVRNNAPLLCSGVRF